MSNSTASTAIVQLKTFFGYYYYYLFHHQPSTFKVGTQTYHYLHHKYNATWRTERAVEVPIVAEWVKRFQDKKILEVGNVLSHYGFIQHTVLDKYEVAKGVINEDVVDFKPVERFDLIISISTLEHVGYDEIPKDSTKFLRAYEHLKNILADKGTLVVTLPIGYNEGMDQLLIQEKVPFTQMICLKRVTKSNKWSETTWMGIKNSRYHHPFPMANGLLIGIFENQ